MPAGKACEQGKPVSTAPRLDVAIYFPQHSCQWIKLCTSKLIYESLICAVLSNLPH